MLAPRYPGLVQAEPGHGPGDLQQEDEADTDGGRDTEGAQPGHDLTGERGDENIYRNTRVEDWHCTGTTDSGVSDVSSLMP